MAPPKAARGRWHFVQDETGFEYSILFTRGEEGDRTRLLLEVGAPRSPRDPSAPGSDLGSPSGRPIRFDLLSAQDPTFRDSTESVRDAETGETWKRRLVLSGYQAIPACSAVKPPDACLVFEGAGGTFATSLGKFQGETADETRRRAAATISEPLATKLRHLGPLMGVTVEMDAYGDDFLRLVWPDRYTRRRGAPSKARRADGCAFDASFGYPCPPRQR